LLDLIFFINSIWSKKADPNRTGFDIMLGIITRVLIFVYEIYLFIVINSLSCKIRTGQLPLEVEPENENQEGNLSEVISPSKQSEKSVEESSDQTTKY
jgi:hypothetical protein